jgi:hypothetical protein
MNTRVTVEPDPAYQGGHALIRVAGAAAFTGAADFRIRREDWDEGVLGPKGWQVADCLLPPDATSVDGNDLLLHLGPSVVQIVESGGYRFAIPAAGIDTAVYWPDLPLQADDALNMVAEPVRAGPRAAAPQRPQIQRLQPEAPPPPPRPGPRVVGPGKASGGGGPDSDETVLIKPAPPPEPVEPEPRKWLPWAALGLVLLLLAGGGYYGYQQMVPPDQPPGPGPAPQAQGQPPATPPASPPPPGEPDLQNMSVADAIRSGAPPAALLREAQRRMQLDSARRSEALLLMQAAADGDFAPAHAALGRLYDPGQPHPPEIQPDPRQAALHYRRAVQGGDTSVAEARAALKSYLDQQSQNGDLYAPLIVKEFWP